MTTVGTGISLSFTKPANFDTRTRTVLVELVHIQGSVAAGKSTLLAAIEKRPMTMLRQHLTKAQMTRVKNTRYTQIICVPEPVAQWTNVNGVNLLERSYIDPDRFGLACQLNIVQTRLADLHAHIKEVVDSTKESVHILAITERSPYVDYKIFASSYLSACDLRVYESAYENALCSWRTNMSSLVAGTVSVAYFADIILRATPTELLRRINKRARKGENLINFETLQFLDEAHTRLFGQPPSTLSTVRRKK